MAKNEGLVPEEELKKLRELDTQLISVNKTLAESLSLSQQFVVELSKSSVPFKELGQVVERFEKQQKKTNVAMQEQQRIQKETEKIQHRIKTAYSEEVMELERLRQVARDISTVRRNIIKEQNAQTGSTEKLRAQLNLLNNSIDRMSEKTQNSPLGKSFIKDAADLNKQLIALEAQTGRHGRNVGNYASHWNGLNVQIQQVARELPALSLGANTFFLAISNNLPMLVDEIKKARMEYRSAVMDGKQGTPVWRQLLSGILSWQTALVVGITVLSMYGKEIVSWVGGLFKVNNAQKTTIELQEEINEKIGDNSGIGAQIINIKKLQEEWSKLGDKLGDKNKFIKENKDEFDKLGVSVNNVKDAENLLVDNTTAFIESLKMKAKATAAYELASKAYEDQLKKQREIEEESAKDPSLLDKIKSGVISSQMAGEGANALGDNSPSSEDFKKDRIDDLEEEAKAAGDLGDSYFKLGQDSLKAAEELRKTAGIRDRIINGNDNKNKKDKSSGTELKASQELSELRLQQQADAQKKILENNKASYDDRMKAANDFEERMGDLIEQKRKHQLSQEGLTASQIDLINENAEAKKAKISEEGGKLRETIYKDHISAQNKIIEDGLTERSQVLDKNEQSEKQRLLQELQSGVITKEEYEQQLLALTVTYSQSRLQAEIEAIQKMLEVSGITEEERLALTQKLRKAELDFNKSILDQHVKAEMDAAKKREEIEKNLAETKKKLGEEVYNFLGSLASAHTEKQLIELETQQEQNDEWRDAELRRIEDQEQKGVISKEQAEAQKWAIDEQSKQNDKKIEEEKRQVLERQARFEKAASLAQITMNTAQAVMKNNAIFGAVIAAPLNAMVIAMGAMQAASVMAQPIPKYKRGTDFHEGGLAIVGDGGRHEMALLPSGEVWKTPSTDTLVDLPRGTQVLPDFSKALANMSVLRSTDEVKPIIIQDNKESLALTEKSVRALRSIEIGQKRMTKQLIRKNSNPFNLTR